MYVSKIALDLFRSWKHIVCDFKPSVNIIYGNNGFGKTNIVEAIEFASTGISHRTSSTIPLITRGSTTSTIRLNICNNSTELVENNNQTTYEINLSLKGSNRARINGGKSLYIKDIVGLLPVVSFTPRDQSLVIGDPTIRRTFLDQAGTLLIPNYAKYLQDFKHIAKQRAALLKNIREFSYANQPVSLSGLEIWTGKFIESGIKITKLRNKTVQILNKYFSKIIKSLTSSEENATLKYEPSFEEVFINKNLEEDNLEDILENSLEDNTEDTLENNIEINNLLSEHFKRIYPGELARGCNLIGPHRDDINFMLDNMPAKDFASNGESWTISIAIKMALCKALEEINNENPIIILDDVFAQLDENRRKQILNFSKNQGQVFITTSSLNDIPEDDEINSNNLINIEKIYEEQKNIDNLNSLHNDFIKEIIANRNCEQKD